MPSTPRYGISTPRYGISMPRACHLDNDGWHLDVGRQTVAQPPRSLWRVPQFSAATVSGVRCGWQCEPGQLLVGKPREDANIASKRDSPVNAWDREPSDCLADVPQLLFGL